jgi:hypothetical protein
VFAHNTIVENTSDNDFGDVAGAVCLINIDAVNNLIYSNFIGPQADGDCDFGSSYVAPGAPNNPMGFIAPEADPPNYKLDGSSDLVVNAGVTSSIDIDFEGDPRPTGSAPDFGADEYVD